MSVHDFLGSVIQLKALRHLSTYELRHAADMADQNGSPYLSERDEDRVKRVVRDIEPRCPEDTVHFHINVITRARVLRNVPVGSVVLPVLCHHLLPCARSGRARLIANHLPE
jgi:hypothetical protein